MEKEYTLIWVGGFDKESGEFFLRNPKRLMGMNRDKALGSIAWTKKILTKSYPCFIYDPSELSIFKKDGSQNISLIKRLIKKYQ